MSRNEKPAVQKRQITYRHAFDTGERVTTFVLIMTPEQWESSPESTSTHWQTVEYAGMIMACTVHVQGGFVAKPSSPRRPFVPSVN